MNKTQKNLVQRRNTTIGVRFLFSVVLRQASWMVRAAFISLQRRNPLVLFSIFQSKLAAFISIVNPDPELFDSDTDLARIKEKIN